MMKGAGAALPIVDELPNKIKMEGWNNIPIPLKQAFIEIIETFKGLKHSHYENYNAIVEIKRVVNSNQ